MAINYDLILKYLVKEEEKETFTNQKNFMTYSDKFPNEFKNILGDKFYRMGVTQNNEQKNISFYTSLITLLDNNIMSITEKEEIHKVNEFLSDINNKIKVLPEYLKQIPKDVIKKNLKDKESNIWIYELIANYLKLNFIIFDFKTLEILTIYYGDVMDPWRTCLFLAKNEDSWEPIRNNEKKFFCYNDNVLKKILSQNSINIKYFNNKIIKKDFVIFDNLEELVNDITKSEQPKDFEHSDDEKNTIFIKTEIKMSEDKLNKMTKLELINHLKLLNKKPLSKATKKDLILLILKS